MTICRRAARVVIRGAEKMMTLRLKRDRKIVNKNGAYKAAAKLEACVREIQSLETVRHRKRQYGRWQQE